MSQLVIFFEQPDELTEADLNELQASLPVRAWAYHQFYHYPDRLELLLTVIIEQTDWATTRAEAPQALASLMNGSRPSGVPVKKYLETGKPSSGTFDLLRRAVRQTEGRCQSMNLLALRDGRLAHELMAHWLGGWQVYPDLNDIPHGHRSRRINPDQLELFSEQVRDRWIDYYRQLIDRYQGVFYAPGQAPDQHLNKIQYLVDASNRLLAESDNWISAVLVLQNQAKEMIDLLFPFFGEHLIRIGYGLRDDRSNLILVSSFSTKLSKST